MLFAGITVSFAQTRVNGVVTSADDGQPVAGATVVVKGTHVGVVTNAVGEYSISVPAGSNVLVAAFIGYQPQEMAVASVVNFSLQVDAIGLEDVIVTGYGSIGKKAFTGSATVVKTEELNAETNANFMKSMQGAVSGMQVNMGSGQPGSPATVYIRGMGSINAGTQPLYVVDGVPLANTSMARRNDEGMELSPLSALNSEDIESVTVLKDATATSIYGARASNGVIVITTKKGKIGALSVNVKVRGGVATPTKTPSKMELLDGNKYLDFQTTALMNAFGYPTRDDAREVFISSFGVPTNPATNQLYNTNWYDEVTRTGVVQDYNIDLQGGGGNDGKQLRYYVSGGFYDETGIVIGKDLRRYSGRVNLSQSPNKVISWGLTTGASYSEVNNGAGGGYYSDPITLAYNMMSPLQPVKHPDGTWNFDQNGYNPVAQYTRETSQLNPNRGDLQLQKQYKFSVTPYVDINFLKNFTFTSRFGIDYYGLKEEGLWSKNQPQGNGMNMLGEYSDANNTNWIWTNTLRYRKTIGDKHNITALVGQEAQKTHFYSGYAAGSNFPNGALSSLSTSSVPGSASSAFHDYALASYFVNAEYDFANKYYLSGSFRYDGSSRFGDNNKYAPFWSVGAKYRMMNEEFMSGAENWLKDLTVRASYGTTGNQDIYDNGSYNYYASQALVGYGLVYNEMPGSRPTQAANPDLKWEQTNKFNVGLDLNFKDIITVSADYYNDVTSNMIFAKPLSRTTGLSYVLENVGKMKNSGIEALITANIFNKENFKWSMALNITHNKNKIIKLATREPIIGGITIREEGRSYNQFYMKEWAGVDSETGQGLWYEGTEGDKVTTNYNKAGRRYLGTADPKIFGGFSTSFTVYNFDLNAAFSYKIGGKLYANASHYIEHVGGGGTQNTTNYVYDNMWTTPGQNAAVPQAIWGGNGSSNATSSRFLMDGSYLKLKNITLGYTLPKKAVKSMLLSNVRVYVSADNIWTARNGSFRGVDPETTPDGILWFNYPMPANILFGINVSF